jgi:multidrug resistance efflux pump
MDREEEKQVEIRNVSMDDFIGRVPGWIVRWGTTLVFAFVFVLFLFAAFFHFPDSVQSGILITTENPPAGLMAHTSGNIQKIFVHDNQQVVAGDLLLVIKNPADYNDLVLIQKWAGSTLADSGTEQETNRIQIKSNSFRLGEVQQNLATCLNRLSDYEYFLNDNPDNKRIEALILELERYRELNVELAGQCTILKKECDLIHKQHGRNIALHASHTISDADLEKSESAMLEKDYEYGQAKVELAGNRLKETTVEHEIETIRAQIAALQQEKKRNLFESMLNLDAAIATWENKYTLQAPFDGIVSFSKIWNENQTVAEGDLVMTVIPVNQGPIIGKVRLPMDGAGKVQEGQQVVIKLDNYPYLEFGMLKGYVKSIAAVPNESGYLVKVSLPDSLCTNAGKIIPFKQEMQGNVEIITEHMTLLTRIMNPIRSVVRRQKTI